MLFFLRSEYSTCSISNVNPSRRVINTSVWVGTTRRRGTAGRPDAAQKVGQCRYQVPICGRDVFDNVVGYTLVTNVDKIHRND